MYFFIMGLVKLKFLKQFSKEDIHLEQIKPLITPPESLTL